MVSADKDLIMDDKPDIPETPEKKEPRKKSPVVKPPMPMKGFAMWFLMMALVLMALQFFQKPELQELSLIHI